MIDVALRTISLCTGYGGLELGIRSAGVPVRVVAAVERQAYAGAVLASRMEEGAVDPCPIWDDLESFDGFAYRDRVDLVVAGFPCQGASVAGKRHGVRDKRWLWPLVWRTVRECRASLLFIENVPGLLTVNDGAAFAEILGELAAVGWIAEWDCVSAESVGAPHVRDRVFLLAADPDGLGLRKLAERDQQLAAERGDAEPHHDGCEWSDVPDASRGRCQPWSHARRSSPDRGTDTSRGREPTTAADTSSERHEARQHRRTTKRDKGRTSAVSGSGQNDAPDPDRDRLQGEWDVRELDEGERSQRRGDPNGCRVSPGWSSIIGRPSPEPAFRRVDDGDPDGLDQAWRERIHLIGNGVVPLAVARAFTHLRAMIVR